MADGSLSIVIKEIQIKGKMRYANTLTRMTKK